MLTLLFEYYTIMIISIQCTHAALLDPDVDLVVADLLAAAVDQPLHGVLLQAHAAAALLVQMFVSLPQLQQSLAAPPALRDLLQEPRPPAAGQQ